MATEQQTVRMEFRGTLGDMVKWFLLWIGGALLVIPLAWVTAASARWFCRELEFSDGTTAEFRGTGGDVVVWHVFLVLTIAAAAALRSLVSLAAILILAPILLTLLRWFVHNLRLSSGPQLAFVSGRIKGPGVAFELEASWFEIAWHLAVVLIGAVFLLPIPFVKLWWVNWLVSRLTMRRGVDTSWSDFTQKRAPRKPTSRATPTDYGRIT